MKEPITPDHILQTGMAFWASKTLLSATEIGVFTELVQALATLDTLKQQASALAMSHHWWGQMPWWWRLNKSINPFNL